MKNKDWLNHALLGFSLVLLVLSLYLIFLWVPTERTMGIVQRIFYWHVSLAWVAFLAFFITFVGSVLFLVKKSVSWDRLAHSSADIGVFLTGLVLVSGSIWARPIWGTWWVWEPRLTTALVLMLIYIGYLMVRSYSSEAQGPKFGAVVGIIGFIDVPIVFMSIRWWRTIHPAPVIAGGEGSGLDPRMMLTLMVSVAAFTVFFWLLLRLRIALRTAEEEINLIQRELEL
ncbi:MAG: cytochrome c biogenesis protein CcsA [Chloroflexi bacterium]|nr:cytochrome c biogenesis protein CcsA [Chloroflexota bacterium]